MRRLLALLPSVAALDVLCVGCSGGTGVRAVRGLIANGLEPSSLRFMTRDPKRPTARTLAGLGLTPVVGDLDDATSLTRLAAGNYGACYVHGTSGDEKKNRRARGTTSGGARRGLRGDVNAAPRRLQLGVRAR